MAIEGGITIAVLVTIAGGVIKLAFQSGKTINAIDALTSRVEKIAERMEQTVEVQALARMELTRQGDRISHLERWVERADRVNKQG